jgi:hypothetical protein
VKPYFENISQLEFETTNLFKEYIVNSPEKPNLAKE